MPENPFDILMRYEGTTPKGMPPNAMYKDSRGYLTGPYGVKVDPVITQYLQAKGYKGPYQHGYAEVPDNIWKLWRGQRYNQNQLAVQKLLKEQGVAGLPQDANHVLTRMAYQMGPQGVAKFKNTWTSLAGWLKRPTQAGIQPILDEMGNSKWAKSDSPARAAEEIGRFGQSLGALVPRQQVTQAATGLPKEGADSKMTETAKLPERSETLERGPHGMWHDTVAAELGGAAAAGATALAYYAMARRNGHPNPAEALIPGAKMGLLLGSIPYVAGAMVGSMSGYPSTGHMNKLEESDWPSYLIPGRAGYRSGKRVRYLLEIARRNRDELQKMSKPKISDMPTTEAVLSPLTGGVAKEASDDTGQLLAGGALIGGLLAGGVASLAMLSKLRQVKGRGSVLTKAELRDIGAPPAIPQKIQPGLDNAYFEPPPYSPDIPIIGAEREPDESKSQYANRLKYGRLVYGGGFRKPGIMFHEAGHAAIDQLPVYHPANIMQRMRHPLFTIPARIGSVLGGAAIGAELGPGFGTIAGGLGGAALGAITSMPTLWSEYGASSRAMDRLDKAKISDKQKEENKALLRRAWMTYAVGATAVPALAGIAMSFAGRR